MLRSSAGVQVHELACDDPGSRRVLANVYWAGDEHDELFEACVLHQLQLIGAVEVEGLVPPAAVERVGEMLVVVRGGAPGRSLASLCASGGVGTELFCTIALGLTQILMKLHAAGLLHRDIKPSSVYFDEGSGRVYLVDVGVAALLERERCDLDDPALASDALACVAPEQVSAVGRAVDARSDLYSLGAIFYQMLTGALPFPASSVAALIDAQIATVPRPLHGRVAGLPRVLGELVAKLLEKDPARRYQTASGLLADLQRFAEARASGDADPWFELGGPERATGLTASTKLYGSEVNVRTLALELGRVRDRRDRRLMVVHGPHGMGKSALLEALEPVVVGAAGSFAFGRYRAPDQLDGLNGLDGLSGLVDALVGVVERIAIAPHHGGVSWREHLVAQLGSLLPVLTALVPAFERIVGPVTQPAITATGLLDAGLAGHALELALCRLFVALERLGTPVLVLDDLQWADARSVELLRALLFDENQTPLLIVVACTNVALEANAPLGRLMAELGQGPGLLPLERLRRATLAQLVGELLGGEFADLVIRDNLVDLVEAHTDSVPGAVRSYLAELVERGLLYQADNGWEWTGDALAKREAAPERVELGDEHERRLLAGAACLGPRFSPGALTGVCELSHAALAATLHELERRRVLVRCGSHMQFGDPQLRAQARTWLAPGPRAAVHASSAERLLARHGPIAALGGHAFALAHHLFNMLPAGGGATLEHPRRAELVECCAVASERAVLVGARDTARAYLEFAATVGPAGVNEHSTRAAELDLTRASVLAWCGRDAEADAAFEQLLARALPMPLAGRVVVAAIRSLVSRGRSDEALALGLGGLARCNLASDVASDVASDAEPDLATVASRVRARLTAQWPSHQDWLAALAEGPELANADVDAAMSILAALERALIDSDFGSFARLACVHAELVAIHGSHRTAPAALAAFGLVLAAELGEAELGAQICDGAVSLCARGQTEVELRLWAESVALLRVWPLTRPARQTRARKPSLLRETVEHGALELAAFTARGGVAFSFIGAVELAGVSELIARGQRWTARLDPRGAIDSRLSFEAWRRVAQRLQRPAEPDGSTRWLAAADLAQATPATRAEIWIRQSVVQWLLGDRDAARASASWFVDALDLAAGRPWTLGLGVAMTAIMACEHLSPGERPGERAGESGAQRARAQLEHARARAATFATQGWTKLAACAELVEAEHARALGSAGGAWDLDRVFAAYERVCELAEHIDSACIHALACERLLSLARAHQRRATARGATLTAIARARRWGAQELVAQLERGHVELLADLVTLTNLEPLPAASVAAPDPNETRDTVDPDLLVGMLSMIGEDLDLDEVISRVLESALATSGAERGVLLLERDTQLVEVARVSQGAALIRVDDPEPLANAGEQLPVAVIEHVMRTGTTVIIDDATADPRFASDPYIQLTRARSLLSAPISGPGGQFGALLLEHPLVPGVFNAERVSTLRVLVSQAGATLGHARIHEALERSQALFQTVVSGAPDIIALLDRHGRVEFLNHLAGFTADPATLIGMDAALMMGASMAPRWRAAVASAFETGEQQDLEVDVELPDGETRWYSIRLCPVEFGGRHGKLLSVATDISARKRAEAQRLSLEAQLRQQQRLDSVGTLASGVAHEINNPIQGIMNYAELIAGRASDPKLVEEFAGEILMESDRVATIVRNLLAFSRQDIEEPPELRLVDALVATTLTLFRAVVTRDGIVLAVDTPTGLPPVRCRPQQIQQVIMNLVTNARDAVRSLHPDPKRAPAGSNVISISARVVETEHGRLVRLSVADHGGGVPEHVRARIFDPFFTTKGRDQGTGLGLAVSHGIVRDHGGELWFETEVGSGSVFHMDLPVESS
ncbi:sensory box histidine kinase/response regulator [Enhygromyxa salina]|uniref:histidine kinase n=1 Tax=Enhygromyxa salina TaxID=215803 RepID=A0A0C2CVH9_9BACT|nr:sensory box histidine kinase/response regulator [Enhygromyxa salina]